MSEDIINIDSLYVDFKQWLKENKTSEYRCDSCGYSQGHQIIWCPKCGCKVIQRKNIAYWDCVKYGDLRDSGYFKMKAQSFLKDGYMSWGIYKELCNKIEDEITSGKR